MADHYAEQAKKIVEAFKYSLNEELCKQINSAQFDVLESEIRQALSNECAVIIEQIEGVVKKLRMEVDKPELEL